MSQPPLPVTSHAEADLPCRAPAGAGGAYIRTPSDERLAAPLLPPASLDTSVPRASSGSSLLGAAWPSLTRSDSAAKTAEALLDSFSLSRQSSDARSAAGRHSPRWDVWTRPPSAAPGLWDAELQPHFSAASPERSAALSPDGWSTSDAALLPVRGFSGPRPSVDPLKISEVGTWARVTRPQC
jgi:hypothetical protein